MHILSMSRDAKMDQMAMMAAMPSSNIFTELLRSDPDAPTYRSIQWAELANRRTNRMELLNLEPSIECFIIISVLSHEKTGIGCQYSYYHDRRL